MIGIPSSPGPLVIAEPKEYAVESHGGILTRTGAGAQQTPFRRRRRANLGPGAGGTVLARSADPRMG